MGVLFVTDPDIVAGYLPPEITPEETGRASFVFGDWASSADDDPCWLADPGRSQYLEAYVILYGTANGRPVGRVPFIWVNSDLAIVRGIVQGFAKKHADIALTRAVQLGRGGVRREPGARFVSHVTSLGRRICTAAVTLERAEPELWPDGMTRPVLDTRLLPAFGDTTGVREHARNVVALHRARWRPRRLGHAQVRGLGVRGARAAGPELGDRRLGRLGRVLDRRRTGRPAGAALTGRAPSRPLLWWTCPPCGSSSCAAPR
jgi:hypothetical protein